MHDLSQRDKRTSAARFGGLGWIVLGILATSCDDGDRGPQGPPGPPGGGVDVTDDELERDEDAPGVNVSVLAIEGASGADGTFQVGDTVSVRFRVDKDDGTAWDLAELSTARALVSGPTFHYQRVLAEKSDLATESTTESDGSHVYTFVDPIPATYLPPLNDTDSLTDGELTGQALLAGTYTLGMYFGWSYSVEEDSFRDVGNATSDFLFGGAQALQPRAVVAQDNCNQCHSDLQAHGAMRKNVTLCLLCHTAGSEDRNTDDVAGGTPGATVDFRVMIHKIHNGGHLPSVLGVGTLPDGSRDYAMTPEPYQLVGFGDSVHDYSNVAFPIWPSLSFPMPRDAGYSGLTADQQALENTIRSGVVDCATCHGDPDGDGPITAPAQGDIAYEQPSRLVCGSCHDDIDWDHPYTSNGQTMPEQATDSACVQCHEVSGSALDVVDAHRHPMLDSIVNPGLQVEIVSIEESGTNNGDGHFDPGEEISVTFDLTDDEGNPVDATGHTFNVAMTGPTHNMNLVLYGDLPVAALAGSPPYTIDLPAVYILERVGLATGGSDAFQTAHSPHWSDLGAATKVYARSATAGGSAFLTADAMAPVNYFDVDDASGFDRNDFLVVDDGEAEEEYLQVQWVDGNRIWFSSPYQTGSENGGASVYKHGTTADHLTNAAVEEVTLDLLVEDTDYSLDPATGTITELSDFGDGNAVIASYTSDFVLPARHGLALNDTPAVDETWGQWTGKPLAEGTYRVGLWGSRTISHVAHGETTSYRATALSAVANVLVGGASEVEPWDLISSIDNCAKCHQDIYFHGGSRRGLDTCLHCHGTAGAEDRPRFRAANAPETPETLVQFRQMLHKIHKGADLANAETYTVVGFGSGYPDNYSTHTYEHVEFPALPGGTRNCAMCHGEGTSWTEPSDTAHPLDQSEPARPWRTVCASCHDSDAARGHIEAQTPPGFHESCEVCHGPDKDLSVEIVHKAR